ncbi:autotransporter-associated beta strand repeat-containing protein [Akkermansia massiliensis]
MVEREGGEDYNVVLIKGEVRPASIRVKDGVNYIFRAHADGGLIADGELPDDYETNSWKTILTKDGAGTLVMETANTYSGGTEINGGRVVMRDAAALGTGEIRMFDGTSLALDYQSGGFIQKVALLNNLLTVAEDSVVTVSHTDTVIGAVISAVRGIPPPTLSCSMPTAAGRPFSSWMTAPNSMERSA